jgi:hypothetical protein
MTPVAIFLFLTGAVLAWRFRVWILVPLSLIVVVATFLTELSLGAGLAAAFGDGLFVGFAPQMGYAFGLVAQSTLVTGRASSRKASIAALYRQTSAARSRQ